MEKLIPSFLFVIFIFVCNVSTEECGVGPKRCPNWTKYRSFDGSCNNLEHPKWGSAGSEYGRLKPAKYSDLNGSFPLSVSGNPLPNPRKMSVLLYLVDYVFDKKLSLNAMAYGQLVTHDMGFTYLSTPLLTCCSNTLRYIPNTAPDCVPIHIDENDPVYSKYHSNCMSMPRTNTNRDHNCSLERKQIEKLSYVPSYMDLHMIYGISNETAANLRAFKDGLLNSSYSNGQHWLPLSNNVADDCFSVTDPPVCYESVDPRVNDNTDLTLLHIIYMREHQRIALELGRLNPHWDDERIYQETRNIVIAIHQFISYDEWLPVIFGKDNLLNKKIIYDEDNFVDDYDERKRGITFNEFAHGANRHFHSMIADHVQLSKNGRNFSGYINISDWMKDPVILEIGDNFDDFARGLQCQYSMANDKYHGIQVTSQVFKKNFPLGLDLKSIDIHRSRDHGLASYNDMREYCGLPKAKNFSDFRDVIRQAGINKLRQIYESVDDVDLVVAGMMETFVPGAITGPTFFCILTKQYLLTRISDRFWHENGRSGLTLAQLQEIHKISISKLLCNNGRNITMMQPQGFYPLSESNDLVPCDELPEINLTYWKENP